MNEAEILDAATEKSKEIIAEAFKRLRAPDIGIVISDKIIQERVNNTVMALQDVFLDILDECQ